MAKIFRPIRNACGVALDIVDETCRLDSQVQRMLVDGASDIEVAMVNDDGIQSSVRLVRIVTSSTFSKSAYKLKMDVGTM